MSSVEKLIAAVFVLTLVHGAASALLGIKPAPSSDYEDTFVLRGR